MAAARLQLASFATPSTSVTVDADSIVFELDRHGHPHVLGAGTSGKARAPSVGLRKLAVCHNWTVRNHPCLRRMHGACGMPVLNRKRSHRQAGLGQPLWVTGTQEQLEPNDNNVDHTFHATCLFPSAHTISLCTIHITLRVWEQCGT